MKTSIDVHCNRDLIDIFQDEQLVGQESFMKKYGVK